MSRMPPKSNLSLRNHPTPADQRHAACTHMIVTRLYDTYGSSSCQLCQKHPSIGWLYRCTQDHGGWLPEADFSNTAYQTPTERKDNGFKIGQLSPWIVTAIREGQYTDEQIKILIEQKDLVRRNILNDGHRTSASSSSSDDSTLSSTTEENTTGTTTSSIHLEEELFRASDCNLTRFDVSKDVIMDIIATGGILPSLGMYDEPYCRENTSACSWRVCHSCRPTYRDRAFQHLNQILNSPFEQVPRWELENRRISDAAIVAKIGTQKSGPNSSSPRNIPSARNSSMWSNSGGVIGLNASGYLQRNHSVRGKSIFREAVRKVLDRAVRPSSSVAELRLAFTRNFSPDALKDNSRSTVLVRRKQPNQTNNERWSRVIDDSPLYDPLMLMVAVNTPLPDAAGDSQDAEGEVDVEDGVAVTEEGVGLSAADIVIQA